MFIFTQDKKRIVNMDNVRQIYLSGPYYGHKADINADFGDDIDACCTLGSYTDSDYAKNLMIDIMAALVAEGKRYIMPEDMG